MAGGKSDDSALETARVRFLESLPRKSVELGASVAALAGAAVASAGHTELRQRLHALYASALVFRLPALCNALEQAIATLDRAAERGGRLAADELGSLAAVVSGLPNHADTDAGAGLSLDADDEPSQIMRAVQRLSGEGSERPEAGHGLLGAVHAQLPRALASAIVADAAPVVTRTLRVLVLARSERNDLGQSLIHEALRVEVVPDAEALLAAAREEPPDAVLADAGLAHNAHLAAQLRGDPITDYLPIVLFRAPADGALALDALRSHVDAVVTTPIATAELLRVLGRVTGTLLEARAPLGEDALGSLTLGELAQRVAESVRRGILDAAEGAHTTELRLADDTPVRAAALAAIANVRAFVEEQSGGRVRFDDRAGSGHPGLLQLAGGVRDDIDLASLGGRRVLLVDDDTGVVVMLAGLLRGHGATVVEATDGDEALASARTERPDLVITDVLMPGRDGLSFCRELAHDPLLADVPVLLIPSKEELLLCIRDAVGEPAMRRREQLGRRVLTQAAVALAPRVALEQELRAGGEVRGSLDSTGVVALLRSVRRIRPDARIVLRDAWNAFEVLFADGRIARVTRTAADGSFVRDEQALPALLGVGSGRFAVESAPGPVKATISGTLDEVLTRGADELAAQLAAVRLPALAGVSRVVFDEDAVSTLQKQGSDAVKRIVAHLHGGGRVDALALALGVELRLVETLLLDLTRRGLLREVEGPGGSDAIAAARAAHKARAPSASSSPLSRIPPPPAPVISVLPSAPAPVSPTAGFEPASPTAGFEPDARPRDGGAPTPALDSVSPAALAQRTRWAAWGVGLLALMAVGFLLGRQRDPRAGVHAVPEVSERAAPAAPSEPERTVPVPSTASIAPLPAVEAYIAPEEIGFRVTPGVPNDLAVQPGQGVVVIGALPGVEAATLSVDDRLRGAIPQRVALGEGIHELALQHGDATTYRFVFVRPGHTYALLAL